MWGNELGIIPFFCYKLKVIHILICILRAKEKRVEINPIKFELFHTPFLIS